MGATEVTVASFEKFCAATKRDMPRSVSVNTGWRSKDAPMVWVSADDARAYCAWAGGRLPTESEWEYAARGGVDGMIFPWGDEISHENANYGSETRGQPGHAEGRDKWIGPSPVGSFPPNGYGLFDMAGNVWEWVELDPRYNVPRAPLPNPAYPASKPYNVAFRGGSFMSPFWQLTVSTRSSSYGQKSTHFGFRCAKDIAP